MSHESRKVKQGLAFLTVLLLAALGFRLYHIGSFKAVQSWLELSALLGAMAFAVRLRHLTGRQALRLKELADEHESADGPIGSDEVARLNHAISTFSEECKAWRDACDDVMTAWGKGDESCRPEALKNTFDAALLNLKDVEIFKRAFDQTRSPMMMVRPNSEMAGLNQAMKDLFKRYFPSHGEDAKLNRLWSEAASFLKDVGDGFSPWSVVKFGDDAFEIRAMRLPNTDLFLVEWQDPNPRLAWHREINWLLQQLEDGVLSARGRDDALSPAYQLMMEETNKVIHAIVTPLQLLEQHLHQAASGDLRAYVTETVEGNHPTMTHAFHRLLNSFNEVISRVRASASSVDGAAGKMGSLSQGLGSVVVRMKAVLDLVASALQDLQLQANCALGEVKQIRENGADNLDRLKKAGKKLEAVQFGISDTDRDLAGILGALEGLLYQIQLISKAASEREPKGAESFSETLKELTARGEAALVEINNRVKNAHTRLGEVTDLGKALAGLMKEILAATDDMLRETSVIAMAAERQLNDLCGATRDLESLRPLKKEAGMKTNQSVALSEKLREQSLRLQEMADRFKTEITGTDPFSKSRVVEGDVESGEGEFGRY